MTTTDRYIAPGYVLYSTEARADGAVVYVHSYSVNGGATSYVAQGFRSARVSKPDFHHSFPTVEKRDAHIARFFASLDSRIAFKADRKDKVKAAKASGHPFVVGTLFVNSWGYEQTNIDFYKVVAATAGTVELIEVGYATQTEVCWEQYKVTADPDKEIGKPFKKRVQFSAYDGKPYVTMDHGGMSVTEVGKVHHRTSYY